MRKALCAAAMALAFTAGSAFAADLPSRKEPAYIPPPPPMWTGFYVGLNAGGAWSDSNSVWVQSGPFFQSTAFPFTSQFSNAAAAGATGVLSSGSNGGFIGGGQVGYNYQFGAGGFPGFGGLGGGAFVVGVEADIQGIAGSSGNVSAATAVPVLGPWNVITAMSANKGLDYLGTVRGRLGYLVTPTLLVYGTGGLAYGGVTLSVSGLQAVQNDFFPFSTVGFGASAFSDTRVGWTVGGGAEWMFMPNWSAKVEYLYYDLGSVQNFVGSTARFSNGALLWANATRATASYRGNIVRAGVNYHFNWGAPAPVLAKY